MDIGFIGLGIMGTPMALHLAAAGQKLVRDAERTATDLETEVAGRLSPSEFKTLIKLLQKVYLQQD